MVMLLDQATFISLKRIIKGKRVTQADVPRALLLIFYQP